MSDFINKDKDNGQESEPVNQTKKYFLIALGCCVLGAILLGLSFIPFKVNAGQYFIFASMIVELAAITFLNVQKKYGYFTACKAVRVISYAVMLVGAGIIGYVAAFKLANS